ncbi:MAG: gamma-glutamyl-gamma-aminobutyrate hydrolase family protein [Anaerolineae bacterium]|nr:gamma-glutamyl-gamma-aminobutyrate hydrolase family protein [Anaerolineae bacterium]NUQ04730.1 gamma-glutamyl-gamma-aminobutyrate hydrolase family protein [Anaerolineae bacterium]
MTALRPLIGISMSSAVTPNGRRYHRSYAMNAQSIADAGGLPVYVPSGLPDDLLREIYDRLDGVLLPGGGDVRPSVYGAETHPATHEIDDARDALEIMLARWAYADDLPVFGICRGHQVLNVALGGTLVQDIPSEVGPEIIHDTPETMPRSTIRHEVMLVPGSRLSSILGGVRFEVNSLHHQSVGSLAPGVILSALSPQDEVVEALEAPDKRFTLSVQWHPEDMYQTYEPMARLFTAFIDAARDTMKLKRSGASGTA